LFQFPSNGKAFRTTRKMKPFLYGYVSFHSLQTGKTFRTSEKDTHLQDRGKVSIPFKRETHSELKKSVA